MVVGKREFVIHMEKHCQLLMALLSTAPFMMANENLHGNTNGETPSIVNGSTAHSVFHDGKREFT